AARQHLAPRRAPLRWGYAPGSPPELVDRTVDLEGGKHWGHGFREVGFRGLEGEPALGVSTPRWRPSRRIPLDGGDRDADRDPLNLVRPHGAEGVRTRGGERQTGPLDLREGRPGSGHTRPLDRGERGVAQRRTEGPVGPEAQSRG